MHTPPQNSCVRQKRPLLKATFVLLIILTLAFSSFLTLQVPRAEAASATIFLTPTASSYTVGKTFPVKIKVNTGGSSINAAQGKISFDSQRLSLVRISKSGSIFSLWTNEPEEKSEGIIEFGGGVPNPGFIGSSGTIVTLTFRANEPGDTSVNFISGAVLANDGKGTNILSSLGGAKYSLNPLSFIPSIQAPVETSPGTPAAPRIISSTHPDPDSWYRESTADFEWSVPGEISGLRLLIGKISTSLPTVLYEPPIDKKRIEDLEDGIWYFHARFRNSNGWGQVAHFPVKVDTVPPKQFQISVDGGDDPTNPSPNLFFQAVDATSGIAEYQIQIGDEESFSIAPSEVSTGFYKSRAIKPGKHEILIKAIDRAGNLTLATVNVTIEGIEAPIITDYPSRVTQGNDLTVDGTSLPDVKIIVSIEKDGEEAGRGNTKADSRGEWKYNHSGDLLRGNYTMVAIAEDSRGAQSFPSDTVSFSVSSPLFLKFGKVAIDYLTTMITLIILIVLFVGGIFYGWYAVTGWRKRLRKEVREAEDAVTGAFRELYDDIQEQFETLEDAKSQQSLTKEEKEILQRTKKNLKIAEKFIKKEIKDIEKEVS